MILAISASTINFSEFSCSVIQSISIVIISPVIITTFFTIANESVVIVVDVIKPDVTDCELVISCIRVVVITTNHNLVDVGNISLSHWSATILNLEVRPLEVLSFIIVRV